ncbi:unnamed protein product [Rhizophagus irregularis]|nr:unnamed protein product [Rhizophagus irregularis]
MECDSTTIRRFIDKYKKTGKTENLLHSGWPSALNNNEKNALINETLYDARIHSHIATKKPFISKRYASVHISWCEKYKEITACDWAQVIFSNEIGKQSRQIRVWKNTGKRFNTECSTLTFKSGQKSVMV